MITKRINQALEYLKKLEMYAPKCVKEIHYIRFLLEEEKIRNARNGLSHYGNKYIKNYNESKNKGQNTKKR